MQKPYFEGYYFKHQIGRRTLCFIVGASGEGEFIQILDGRRVYHIPKIGANRFTARGILVDIRHKDCHIKGALRYGPLTPLRYDIMGPLKFLPLECRHGVVSMRHALSGSLLINGETVDFSGGVGYIEKDSGVSFPSAYQWVQCNNFSGENTSIMAAVATIPFCGLDLTGCTAAILHRGREIRLATYLGAKVLHSSERRMVLRQGKRLLEANLFPSYTFPLKAPLQGRMNRIIRESPGGIARFRLFEENRLVFDLTGRHAGMEFAEPVDIT